MASDAYIAYQVIQLNGSLGMVGGYTVNWCSVNFQVPMSICMNGYRVQTID